MTQKTNKLKNILEVISNILYIILLIIISYYIPRTYNKINTIEKDILDTHLEVLKTHSTILDGLKVIDSNLKTIDLKISEAIITSDTLIIQTL